MAKLDKDDFFGTGAVVGDFLLKAHTRVPVRPARLPVAQDIIDRSVKIVDARYSELHSAIESILKTADMRKSIGLIVIDGGLKGERNDLLKAVPAGGAPKPQAPKAPVQNQSGQLRAAKGTGSANYKRADQDQAKRGTAGTRGGKWYINSKGNIVYGTKPTGMQRELTDTEVATHLKQFRPLPMFGVEGAGDKQLVDYLFDNHQAHGFTPSDIEFLQGWFGTKNDKTGEWEGGMIETFNEMYDIKEGDDLGVVKLSSEWTGGKYVSYQEAVHGFLKEQYEAAGMNFEEDVEPHLTALFKRYEDLKANPKLKEALQDIGHKVEKDSYDFFIKAADHEDAMKDFDDLVTGHPADDKQAQTVGASLAAMDLLFIPKKGETAKSAGLKGAVSPNAVYLKPHSDASPNALLADPKRMQALPTAQLVAIAIAGNLYSCWNDKKREFVMPEEGFEHNDAGQAALMHLQARFGLNPANAKVVLKQINDATTNLANRLNDANAGRDQVFKTFISKGSDVIKDKEAAAAIQKRHEEWMQTREAALAAQLNEDFDVPASMADGVLGSVHQKTPLPHQQILDAEGQPTGANFELFPHQKQSINWMFAAKRGVLALDAGMGKTPTVITFMEALKEKKPGTAAMLILPPSLMNQWPDEIASYAPGAKDKILNLSGLSLEDRKVALRKAIEEKKHEYILMSTGTLNSGGEPQEGEQPHENDGTGGTDNEMIELLKSFDGAMFIDEVHQGGYKTGDSVRHKIASEAIGDREFAFGMTATPMPNHPIDLFHLTNMFAPGSVGTQEEWEGGLHGVQYNDLSNEWEVANPQNLVELRTRIRPFVFHKLITDPDVEKGMKGGLKPLTTNARSVTIDDDHPMMTYLKPGGMIDHMVQARILELEEDRGEPYSTRTRQKLENLLAVNLHKLCNISPELVDETYKGPAPKLDMIVNDIVDHFKGGAGTEDKPLVLFSSYPQKAFPLLRKRLAAAGVDPSLVGEIHGGKSSRERAFEQDMTNQGKRRVLLVGTMSGGAGLNLQKKSNRIMFLDEPWHQAAKRQAQGRVWRTGQKNAVTEDAYRIKLPQGVSWDERTAEKIGGKHAMAIAMLTDVDVTSVDFSAAADAAMDQYMGGSSEIKDTAKKKKKKGKGAKLDSVKLMQKLKEYYAEEFDGVNEEDPDTIPDVNEMPKKDKSEDYSKYHNKEKQAKLAKEAKHIGGALDEAGEWKSWNMAFRQKNARQQYKVRQTLIDVYKEENGSPEKLEQANNKLRSTVENYRLWYKAAKVEAEKLAEQKNPEAAKIRAAAAEKMKKDFPEAFEKHDFDPKKWTIDDELKEPIGPKNATKPVTDKSKNAIKKQKDDKKAAVAAFKPADGGMKVTKPVASAKPAHIVADKNPYNKKTDAVAHGAHVLLLSKKPKDDAEALKHLTGYMKKIGSAAPEKDAKEALKYMRKTKGVK